MKINNEGIKIGLTAIILLIILSITACITVGPDYKPPTVDMPEKWQTGLSEKLSPETDRLSLVNWWNSFDDPFLTDLVKRAVENNLSLKEAFTRLSEARLRRGITGADQYPSVSSSASGTRSHSSRSSSEMYQAGVDSSWEIDIFGGIRRSIEASDADLESANASLNDVLVSLTAEVATNYVNLRLYQAEMDVTISNLNAQAETYEIVSWRFKAGLVTELDLKKSEYSLEQTKSQVPAVQSRIDQAQNRIAVLLGVNPGMMKDELNKAKPVPVLKDEIKTGIPADLLRQRPDLKKAERDLAAQTARIGAAVSDLYPKISLSGSIKVNSSSIGSLIDSDSLTSSIGPSLSWPVFRAGAIRKNIEIQSTMAERLLIQYRSLVLKASEEVENALASCMYEKMKEASLKKALDAATVAFNLSKMQYSSGLVDFQVLLEAQRTLLSLQDQVTQNEGQITLNFITLYKTLGGGWSPDTIDM
ncbi:MAG: efflux transporter outer membrane subunit [Desulfatiglans sp.]|nr:efflux transporter outer membrane subunit [Desulfatiglans sp.]